MFYFFGDEVLVAVGFVGVADGFGVDAGAAVDFFVHEHGGADVAAGFFEVFLVGYFFGGEGFFKFGAIALEAVADGAVDFGLDVVVGDLPASGFEGGVDEGLFDELFAGLLVGVFELLFELGALVAAVELRENGGHGGADVAAGDDGGVDFGGVAVDGYGLGGGGIGGLGVG